MAGEPPPPPWLTVQKKPMSNRVKNFDYRYCLSTTWIKHCFNKVNVFEPVPFSGDRQQQFYLYQLP